MLTLPVFGTSGTLIYEEFRSGFSVRLQTNPYSRISVLPDSVILA